MLNPHFSIIGPTLRPPQQTHPHRAGDAQVGSGSTRSTPADVLEPDHGVCEEYDHLLDHPDSLGELRYVYRSCLIELLQTASEASGHQNWADLASDGPLVLRTLLKPSFGAQLAVPER